MARAHRACMPTIYHIVHNEGSNAKENYTIQRQTLIFDLAFSLFSEFSSGHCQLTSTAVPSSPSHTHTPINGKLKMSFYLCNIQQSNNTYTRIDRARQRHSATYICIISSINKARRWKRMRDKHNSLLANECFLRPNAGKWRNCNENKNEMNKPCAHSTGNSF